MEKQQQIDNICNVLMNKSFFFIETLFSFRKLKYGDSHLCARLPQTSKAKRKN